MNQRHWWLTAAAAAAAYAGWKLWGPRVRRDGALSVPRGDPLMQRPAS